MGNEKTGLLSRLKRGLGKTSSKITGGIARITTVRMKLDEAMMEELEETFISADVGMKSTTALVDSLRNAVKKKRVTKPDQVRPFLREEIGRLLDDVKASDIVQGKPHVILVVGVNGSGKTTTIGKLANRFKSEGKSVLMAAADTFRAAAADQLGEWSKRAGCDFVRHQAGSDPSSVAFDAIKAAVARNRDVVIVDTAGRLHTRVTLMEELKKMRRIISRELESAPHETLLVLDGTTGQNAITQAKEFSNILPITGIVLTKLDGTSKGGAIIGIAGETGMRVQYLGIGEKIDDLQPFDPRLFAEALL
ncbi:MAG: signal recognition particle receptor FtsY [bacterium]|nr:MAG: signal recognition particle receptor FtsY [bacterium]